VKYVIDASVALRWFIRDERDSGAEVVLASLVDEPSLFAVPELFAFEVFAVLCRTHPRPLEAFTSAVLPLLQGGLLRYPMTDAIARRAVRFVTRGLSGYDACYLALAEELDARWLTFDTKAVAQAGDPDRSVDLSNGAPSELLERARH